MIKVGIIGGSNPMAGELVRLLINHPDVDIRWVNSARYAGRLISDVHHGLLGETDLRISPTADLDKINLLFIFRHKGQTIEWLSDRMIPEELRIIDLSVDMQDPDTAREYDFIYGLPELNRKVMVRGAKRAIIPHPIASLSSLCLLPLAKNGAIDNDVQISISAPSYGEQPEMSPDDFAHEVAYALRELQPTLTEHIDITITPDVYDRAISAEVEIESPIDIGTLQRMYEEFYDDHNFVIIHTEHPEPKEVEGTNKCLISLDKYDGKIRISAIMDAFIKGAAGTAVHDMNLLFGLHERTGLYLKASTF